MSRIRNFGCLLILAFIVFGALTRPAPRQENKRPAAQKPEPPAKTFPLLVLSTDRPDRSFGRILAKPGQFTRTEAINLAIDVADVHGIQLLILDFFDAPEFVIDRNGRFELEKEDFPHWLYRVNVRNAGRRDANIQNAYRQSDGQPRQDVFRPD